MSDTLIKSLKIVLLVAAGILLVLLLFGIALAVNLPWWMGFVFTGLTAALATGAVLAPEDPVAPEGADVRRAGHRAGRGPDQDDVGEGADAGEGAPGAVEGGDRFPAGVPPPQAGESPLRPPLVHGDRGERLRENDLDRQREALHLLGRQPRIRHLRYPELRLVVLRAGHPSRHGGTLRDAGRRGEGQGGVAGVPEPAGQVPEEGADPRPDRDGRGRQDARVDARDDGGGRQEHPPADRRTDARPRGEVPGLRARHQVRPGPGDDAVLRAAPRGRPQPADGVREPGPLRRRGDLPRPGDEHPLRAAPESSPDPPPLGRFGRHGARASPLPRGVRKRAARPRAVHESRVSREPVPGDADPARSLLQQRPAGGEPLLPLSAIPSGWSGRGMSFPGRTAGCSCTTSIRRSCRGTRASSRRRSARSNGRPSPGISG